MLIYFVLLVLFLPAHSFPNIAYTILWSNCLKDQKHIAVQFQYNMHIAYQHKCSENSNIGVTEFKFYLMSPTLGRIWNFFTFSLFSTLHITTLPSQLEDALKINIQKGKIRFKYEHIKCWVTCLEINYLHVHINCTKP